MEILSNFRSFQLALKKINPSKVAVAYIGRDYNKFIKISKIKDIIVSPTTGSNPYAISEVSRALGWEHVYFLDNLHSKIYLGKNGVIIGSANLTRNALDVNGLLEAGVLIQDKIIIKMVKDIFNIYKTESLKNYKNVQLKILKLNDLFKSFNLSKPKTTTRKIRPRGTSRSFTNYSYDHDEHFKLAWWDGGYSRTDEEYNIKKILDFFPGENWRNISSGIRGDLEIARKDDIHEGEWLLKFKVDHDKKVILSPTHWMFIDKKIRDSFNDKKCPDGIFQLEKSNKGKPPFVINHKFKTAFRKVINRKKYSVFRKNNVGGNWFIAKTIPYIPQLIIDIKREL